jgi:hypothetical protein
MILDTYVYCKGGAASSKKALDELSNHQICDLCRRESHVDSLDCVQVMLLFVPDILYFPVNLYDCPDDDDGCPATKK